LTVLTPSSSPTGRSDGSAMELHSGTSTGDDRDAFAAATDFFSAGMTNESATEE
jgi:hypothetical protein